MTNYIFGLLLNIFIVVAYLRYQEQLLCKYHSLTKRDYQDGERLFHELNSINRISLTKSVRQELTQYKFFTKTLNYLILAHKEFGSNIMDSLSQLRKRLSDDISNEKRVFKLIQAGVFEILIIFFFSMLFIFAAKQIVDVSFSLSDLMIIFSWQLIGVISFFSLTRSLKRKSFLQINQYIHSIYLFDALKTSPLSVNKILEMIEYSKIIELTEFQNLKNFYIQIINQLKSVGSLELELVSELVQCVNNELSMKCDEYKKKVKVIKLSCLMLFSVSSYLYTIYAMMGSMSL